MNLKSNGILDEALPTLLENVFKCMSKNLYLLYTENEFNKEINLRDDIVIPNEICDRFVLVSKHVATRHNKKITRPLRCHSSVQHSTALHMFQAFLHLLFTHCWCFCFVCVCLFHCFFFGGLSPVLITVGANLLAKKN